MLQKKNGNHHVDIYSSNMKIKLMTLTYYYYYMWGINTMVITVLNPKPTYLEFADQ